MQSQIGKRPRSWVLRLQNKPNIGWQKQSHSLMTKTMRWNYSLEGGGKKKKTLNFLMIRPLTTKEDFKRIEDICMTIDIEIRVEIICAVWFPQFRSPWWLFLIPCKYKHPPNVRISKHCVPTKEPDNLLLPITRNRNKMQGRLGLGQRYSIPQKSCLTWVLQPFELEAWAQFCHLYHETLFHMQDNL